MSKKIADGYFVSEIKLEQSTVTAFLADHPTKDALRGFVEQESRANLEALTERIWVARAALLPEEGK